MHRNEASTETEIIFARERTLCSLAHTCLEHAVNYLFTPQFTAISISMCETEQTTCALWPIVKHVRSVRAGTLPTNSNFNPES